MSSLKDVLVKANNGIHLYESRTAGRKYHTLIKWQRRDKWWRLCSHSVSSSAVLAKSSVTTSIICFSSLVGWISSLTTAILDSSYSTQVFGAKPNEEVQGQQVRGRHDDTTRRRDEMMRWTTWWDDELTWQEDELTLGDETFCPPVEVVINVNESD